MSDIVKVRRDKKEVLISCYEYNAPSSLLDFKDWIDGLLDDVPEQYRDSACFEIESESDYDGCSTKIEVYYMRPETEEEEKFRLEVEQNREDDRKRFELRQLAELQKKYGVKK